MYEYAQCGTKVERTAFAKSKLIDPGPAFQLAESAPAPARKYSLVCSIYLAAIAVATLGWLWVIAWTGLQLIQLVVGFWSQ